MKKLPLIIFFGMFSFLYAYSPFKLPKDCTNAVIFIKDLNRDTEKQESFYIDDVNKIRELSKKWEFKEKVSYLKYFDSGISPDYDIYLYIEGKLTRTYVLSVSKGLFEKGLQLYKFEPALMNELKNGAKKTQLITEHFDNVFDYRTALEKYKNNPDFIYYSNNDYWADKYEGSFSFNSNKYYLSLEKQLKRRYPKEDFNLYSQKGNTFTVYCNKSFYDSFDMYEKNEFQLVNDITLFVHLK